MLLVPARRRSEEHTSELQSLITISYAVFCLKKKNCTITQTITLALVVIVMFSVSGETLLDYLHVKLPAFKGGRSLMLVFFFFNDTATTEIYTVMNTLSLHDALPICVDRARRRLRLARARARRALH